MARYCSLLVVSAFLSAGGFAQAEGWKITVETIESAPQIDKPSEQLTNYAANGAPLKVFPKELLDEHAQRILGKDILFMGTLFAARPRISRAEKACGSRRGQFLRGMDSRRLLLLCRAWRGGVADSSSRRQRHDGRRGSGFFRCRHGPDA